MNRKQIFWKHFQGFENIGTDKQTFSILYDDAIAEIETTDSLHARIQKFNELIEPQLAALVERGLELATVFLIGFLKKHLPVEKIEEISEQLKKFIERDL